uniref:Uncharacterized protein n=1 Tax=Cucumis melo TaxID=3656 RepID=A0A9I9CXL9_CUCME
MEKAISPMPWKRRWAISPMSWNRRWGKFLRRRIGRNIRSTHGGNVGSTPLQRPPPVDIDGVES